MDSHMADADVDVIVPVLDGGERFRRCLAALTAAQHNVRARVIVVDNGSTDGSRQVAVAAGVTVVSEARRSSYAARNRGLAESTAPVVAFTDADTVPKPDWLERGLAAMGSEGWDLCAGAIRHEPATTWAGRYDELTYLDQEEHVRGGLGFAATANLFVRQEVFAEIGPFDDTLRSGGDLEFCRRAVATGKRLGFTASAVVHHAPREGLVPVLRKAWRLGVGHAEVGRRDPVLLRWGLSPLRLLPDRHVVARHWRRPVVVAVATAASWVSLAARVATLARAGRRARQAVAQ